MANLGLAWVNHLEAAALVASSEVATLPLSNAVDLHGATAWRTGTSGLVSVTADLAQAKPVRALMVAGASFSDQATMRLLLSGTAAHNGNLYLGSTIAMNRALIAGKRSQACLVLPAAIPARYAKIEFTDPGAPGYFDVGHLWLSDLWQPGRNFGYGASGGLQDDSPTVQSIGGQDYTDVRDKYRVERFGLSWLTDAEFYAGPDAIDAAVGTARNVMFIPDLDSIYLNRQALIGRITKSAPGIRRGFNVRSREFEIKERI